MRSTPAAADGMDEAVLTLRQLGVGFATPAGELPAVRDVTLSVRAGECLGVVGESGSGKSQTFLATMGLLPPNARVRGSARLGGTELLGSAARGELAKLRGERMAMLFQDPMSALTPHMRIGDQIAEPLVRHRGMSWSAARARALQLLRQVQLTDAEHRLRQYPHELSGGMRQRVLLAIALACDPALLIADEPTTALDVTIQAQILALLQELKRTRRMALVLITHDFGVVAGLADRVAVMYAGRIVEVGPVSAVLRSPQHPYTRGLLASLPRLGDAPDGPLPSIPGQPPHPHAIGAGCAFAPRCELAMAVCRTRLPQLEPRGASTVACHGAVA